jgi:hypothetical protein
MKRESTYRQKTKAPIANHQRKVAKAQTCEWLGHYVLPVTSFTHCHRCNLSHIVGCVPHLGDTISSLAQGAPCGAQPWIWHFSAIPQNGTQPILYNFSNVCH